MFFVVAYFSPSAYFLARATLKNDGRSVPVYMPLIGTKYDANNLQTFNMNLCIHSILNPWERRINFLFSSISLLGGCFFYIGYDILFFEVCNFTILRLNILMKYSKDIGNSKKTDQTILLSKIAKMHIEILEQLKLSNTFYQINIFISYVLHTGNLCLILLAVQLVSYVF